MPTNLRIETSQLNDQNLITVAWKVSRYQPFYTYSFGLMLEKLYEQLQSGFNITITLNNQLVAYAGWFETEIDLAEEWRSKNLESMPAPRSGGGAAIVTIVISDHPQYLLPLIRAISHVCAGKPVYRKRAFANQRPEMIRPPIKGRVHR